MRRQVVITGLGAASPFGVGMDALWQGLVSGTSAVKPITRFDASGFRSRYAGEAIGVSARDAVPKHYRKAVKVMARDIELAVVAAKGAVEDAKIVTRASLGDPDELTSEQLATQTYSADRMGCSIGAGLIAAETDELTLALATAAEPVMGGASSGSGSFSLRTWGERGMDNLTPLWMLKYLPNMLACHVTILHGAEGPSNTITCAESSGLLSLGESSRVIERGAADLCFTGGGESKVNAMGMLRMDIAGRVAATGTDAPSDGATFVKPFDPASTGTLLGEGAGILIVEEREAAARRGATMYARVSGFGAGHSDTWYRDGENDEGTLAALESAMADAKVRPGEIDAIVPLGSGIASQDAAEAGALRAVFGDRLKDIPLVLLTPLVGCAMAGAGGLLAAVAAKCVREQRLPARVNAGSPRAWLQAGAAASESRELRNVVVLTTSLGGQNAAVVLSRA
jgi:3-oxoacyl-[acyl-carrier-protein] synthase II